MDPGHFLPEEDDKFFESVRAAMEQEENQAQSPINTESDNAISTAEESGKSTQSEVLKERAMSNCAINENSNEKNHVDQETAPANPGANENVENLPFEFYHYYYGINYDMSRLIEIRREWDAYIRPGSSRIPGHWVQPPPPANEIEASYLVNPKGNSG